jgi:hypothetical protein
MLSNIIHELVAVGAFGPNTRGERRSERWREREHRSNEQVDSSLPSIWVLFIGEVQFHLIS